jgi:hypothetical protein
MTGTIIYTLATLHVPLNMTVSGCTVNLKGKVTFNNLIVENGGEVILEPTSMTAKYSGGVYDISDSTPGIYLQILRLLVSVLAACRSKLYYHH